MRTRSVLVALCATVMTLAGCNDGGTTAATSKTSSSTTSATSRQPSATPVTSSGATAAKGPAPLVLIVDGSGSMTAKDAPGPRIDAARAAAKQLLAKLPDNQQVAVLTYGTHTGSAAADETAGCKDISVLTPSAPLSSNRSTVTAAIDGITPKGYTPIGAALTKAVASLPARAASVVLLSDGIDTCAPPNPCDTAKQLVQQHPGLTISTVGFKTEQSAASQLSCIAAAGNGVFVTAANSDQLVRRLVATQNVEQARKDLAPTGIGSIQVGQSYATVVAGNSGFPQWSSGTAKKSTLTGVSGTLTIFVWRDCTYWFDANRTLVAIQPTGGTIDGVDPGGSYSTAERAYGKPSATTKNADGTYTLLFTADANAGTSYQIVFSGDPAAGGTVIRIIYLCRCKVEAQPNIIDVDAYGGSGTFVTPSGKLLCVISDSDISYGPYAACDGGKLPDAAFAQQFCSTLDISIAAVQVDTKAHWKCAGGIEGTADPADQGWWAGRGFPVVKAGWGQASGDSGGAVLPYGWGLRAGPIVCVSRATGVTCTNTTTQATFSTNASVTTFVGQDDPSAG